MFEVTHERMRIGDLELAWAELGEGPPVVLVHGFTRSHRLWLPVARRLARHHRVLAIDLPEAGLSSRPDAPYTLEWHAETLDAWLGALGLRDVDAAGHSYGGGVLQWLLLVNRSRVRRLALVSSGGLGPDVNPILRIASIPGVLESVADPAVAVAGAMLARWPTRRLQLARSWLHDNLAPGTGRALARSVRNVIGLRGQTRSFYEHVARVGDLPPMRVFWGAEDRIIPAHHGERLAATLEGCELVRFERCGHSPPRERSRELSRALIDFFGAPYVAPARLRAAAPRTAKPAAHASRRSASAT